MSPHRLRQVYDVRKEEDRPVLESGFGGGKHAECVWGLCWTEKEQVPAPAPPPYCCPYPCPYCTLPPSLPTVAPTHVPTVHSLC
jgi:hypothetical protein